MLLVNAHVGASPIHGFGLFSEQFIAAGTVVWRFLPGFDVAISVESLEGLAPCARAQVLHYACYGERDGMYYLSSDDDRFCNHSDNPNTAPNRDTMVAVTDIKAGEEITCDYNKLVMLEFPQRAGS